jgi:hypothetical protein
LTIQELTDDFLTLFVESRVRIFDGLEEFVKTSDLAGNGMGRGLQDSMPQRFRILLM